MPRSDTNLDDGTRKLVTHPECSMTGEDPIPPTSCTISASGSPRCRCRYDLDGRARGE